MTIGVTVTIAIRLLGTLEIDVDGRAVDLGGVRQRSLIALLILGRDRPLSVAALTLRLWPDDPPPAATKTIQVYVSRLRRVLGREAARLESLDAGYRFRLTDDEVDAARFEAQLRRARDEVGSEPAAARVTLEGALALWRGPALADLAGQPFATREADRLEGARLEALEMLFEIRLGSGDGRAIVGDLQTAVHDHPERERLRGQLMRALYADHRQAEALEAYQDARRYLVDELGVDPGPGLQEIQGAILRQELPVPSLRAGSRATVADRVTVDDVTGATEGATPTTIPVTHAGSSRLTGGLMIGAVLVGALVIAGSVWRQGGAVDAGDGRVGPSASLAAEGGRSAAPDPSAAPVAPASPAAMPIIGATLRPGVYRTTLFDPTLDVLVGEGWRTSGDTVDAIGLGPVEAPGSEVVFVRIQAVFDDACPAALRSIGSTPHDLLASLQTRSDLEVTEPLPVVFGNAFGLMVDVTPKPGACTEGEGGRPLMFRISERDRMGAVGAPSRLVMLDLGGQTLAIDVYGPDLEAFWPQARTILSGMTIDPGARP